MTQDENLSKTNFKVKEKSLVNPAVVFEVIART